MRLSELVNGDRAPARAGAIDVIGLTADSRKVRPGYLFAALPGTTADGRAFIGEAVARGAVAVLAPDGESGTPDISPEVCVISDANPRRRLARMAARFYDAQPETVVAVTGTSGKTSVTDFTRQIWRALGRAGASLGTLGTVTDGDPAGYGLTTPDPVDLHASLKDLAGRGIDHLAIEASSHGLDQFRLDGLHLRAAAFTGLSHEHLDYHGNMEDYLAAKLRLFTEVMAPGGVAVVNREDPAFEQVARVCATRDHRLISYGRRPGADLTIANSLATPGGQLLDLILFNRSRRIELPLIGDFQAENVLCALALVIAEGIPVDEVLSVLPSLTGVRGRMERVAMLDAHSPVYVDYAHKAAALETVLTTLRPHVEGKLHLVFGCGGDRDRGKRPMMGETAARLADHVIVTDDNPRTEEPATIRAEILAACPGAQEIGDRAQAIATAVSEMREGDVLLIAGKGHESGQIVGDRVLSFDDAEVARAAVNAQQARMAQPLWRADVAVAATGGMNSGSDWIAQGISIDSRSVKPGDLFVALHGDRFDGHDYVRQALLDGAAAAMIHGLPPELPLDAPVLTVRDTLAGLENLARAARARARVRMVAVTGSVGKTGSKEMLARALAVFGETHANLGNLNNHIGAPLSLARMPVSSEFAVMELGMNHAGEIAPLSRLARPHVALITNVEPVHLGHFASAAEIADAKSEIFEGLEPGGVAVLNRDNAWFDHCAEVARSAGVARVLSFGADPRAEVRLIGALTGIDGTEVTAEIDGRRITYALRAVGDHWAGNSLGVLACVHALGLDPARAARALGEVLPGKGRGARSELSLADGGRVALIDESYNASPPAMQAAFKVFGMMRPGTDGRRIAVLGDMRELGESAPGLHAGLAPGLIAAKPDRVHTVGDHMACLRDALPEQLRGLHGARTEEIADQVAEDIRDGDVILVKGSLGTNMAPVVAALRALDTTDGRG